jgi:glycosyltransferase involved in cell wall biosynthesis
VVVKKRVRILMIISLFPPFLGGAERQAYQLAKKLVERGIEVAILTRHFSHLPRSEAMEGVVVYRHIRTIGWRMFFGISYLWSVLLFLCVHRRSYDIIHCHQLHGFHTLAAVWFKWLFGKKVMVKVSSTGITSDFLSLQEITFGRYFLYWARKVDRIIAICSEATKEIMAHGFDSDNIEEIPNGVNSEYFSPGAARAPSALRTITFVGRLDRCKGISFLLNAFKELRDEKRALRLCIVGDGPERSALKALCNELGVTDSVEFKGETPEVLTEYRKADIFVLPSLSEGLSNVVLEAMSCGLPVVATKVGGAVDVVKDGITGLLVEPGNVDQLKDALRKMLDNPKGAEHFGINARKLIEEQYSLEYITSRYVACYEHLMMPQMH